MDLEYLDNRELGERLLEAEKRWFNLVRSGDKEFSEKGLSHPFFEELKELRNEAARRYQQS